MADILKIFLIWTPSVPGWRGLGAFDSRHCRQNRAPGLYEELARDLHHLFGCNRAVLVVDSVDQIRFIEIHSGLTDAICNLKIGLPSINLRTQELPAHLFNFCFGDSVLLY